MRSALDLLGKAGWLFWLCLAFFLGIAALYGWQPDWAFALTIYSPWASGGTACVVLLLASIRGRSKALLGLALIWLLWGFLASDEVHSLVRSTPGEADFRSFRFDGRQLRVASLNCAGGIIDAAREVKDWNPDIVLLQETPPKKELEPLARAMFGKSAGMVVGLDGTILSRFPLRSWHAGKREPMNYVGASARTPWGDVQVVSLRLQPPVLRFDYWSPDCWRAYSEGKQLRRKELKELMGEVRVFDSGRVMILGGDFNAPPDRSIREVMGARFLDTARFAGSGWTLSAINDFPLVRIDQIWVDRRLKPLRTIAVQTKHSDHRMVVCDVLIDKEK